MPDAKKGNILTKQVGPLKTWQWGGVGAGIYLALRFIKSRETASTATTTATTGGDTIPGDTTTSGATSSSTPTFSTLEGWTSAALSQMTGASLSPADALNGVTDWINGQCVTAAQFAGLGNAIETLGLPPGFSTVPTLSVCGSATTPATTPAATNTAAGGELESGSGFYNPGSQSLLGSLLGDLSGTQYQFTHITDPNVLASLPAGTKTFYQPEPGVFAPNTGQNFVSGTALYLQTPVTAAA